MCLVAARRVQSCLKVHCKHANLFRADLPCSELEECQIIDGDSRGLLDTAAFLSILSELKAEADSQSTDFLDQPQITDRSAAARLFCWKVCVPGS